MSRKRPRNLNSKRRKALHRKRKGLECHYCGAPAKSWDHIIPKRMGGTMATYNIVPACTPCNQEKDDKMPTCECEHCRIAQEVFWAKERAKSEA